MYNLNQFCNIITFLRKERGWTQTQLAERIGIAPQSVSKWECGVGFPDVTLFPVIAELFDVPIGLLFGENTIKAKEDEAMENNMNQERSYVFEPISHIELSVNNCCRIRVIDGELENSQLTVQGDAVFMEYILVEKENGRLRLSVKNPGGSAFHWESYDRNGYEGDNLITLYTGVADSDCFVSNWLDLVMAHYVDKNGQYEWICCTEKEVESKCPGLNMNGKTTPKDKVKLLYKS